MTFSRPIRWKLWLKLICCKSSIFSLFVGAGITVVGEKANALKHTIDGLAEVSYKIVGMIMAVAPIGVFGLITPVVAANGPSVLLPLLKVVIAVYLACLLHAVLVYGSMIKFLAGMSFVKFIKGIAPASLMAFQLLFFRWYSAADHELCTEKWALPKRFPASFCRWAQLSIWMVLLLTRRMRTVHCSTVRH